LFRAWLAHAKNRIDYQTTPTIGVNHKARIRRTMTRNQAKRIVFATGSLVCAIEDSSNQGENQTRPIQGFYRNAPAPGWGN
jgi:hypothetical protein